MSQAHQQVKHAISDALDHVEARIEEIVDTFTTQREVEEGEIHIRNRIQQWEDNMWKAETEIRRLESELYKKENEIQRKEVEKEKGKIRDLLIWEQEVAAKQKKYEDDVDWMEAEKARKIEELNSWFRPFRWLGNIVQSVFIGFEMVGEIATMNTANFALGEAQTYATEGIKGGESVPRPEFRPKPGTSLVIPEPC